MKKIHLYDIIPSKNKGEAAILIGLRCLLDHRYGPKGYNFSMISRQDDLEADQEEYKKLVDEIVVIPAISSPYKMRIFQISRMFDLFLGALFYKIFRIKIPHFNRHARCIADSDLILYGHDNIIGHAGVTIPIFILAWYCRTTQKDIVLAYGSVGPFDNPWKKWISRKSMETMNKVLVRDIQSYDFVKQLMPNEKHIFLIADPAYLMKPADKTIVSSLFQQIFRDSDLPDNLIGVTLAPPIISQLGSQANSFVNNLVEVLTNFLQQHQETNILFIPHVYGPASSQDDRELIKKIIPQFPAKFQHRLFTFKFEATPQELKGLISEMKMLIGMRTHSIIAALSCGVPTLGISLKKRFKTNGIFAQLFEIEEYLYFAEELDCGEMNNKLSQLYCDRNVVSEHIGSKYLEAKDILFDSTDKL